MLCLHEDITFRQAFVILNGIDVDVSQLADFFLDIGNQFL